MVRPPAPGAAWLYSKIGKIEAYQGKSNFTPRNLRALPLDFNTWNEPIVARHEARLDGTNAEALRELRKYDIARLHRQFITTDYQTAGRGQGQNGWHATAGLNYLGSLLYQPQRLPVERMFALTQTSSLAALRAITILTSEVAKPNSKVKTTIAKIKWPNDLYLGDRKVAGILIQNGLRGTYVDWSVIGMGLNVNEVDFPPELANKAISLRQHGGNGPLDLDLVRKTVFATSLVSTKHYLEPLRAAELNRDYHENLYRRDEPTDFRHRASGRAFRGKIRGVTAAGELQIEHEIGRVQTYVLREIIYPLR